MRRPGRALLLLSSLAGLVAGAGGGLSAGCGSGGGAADAGPPVDARHLGDAAEISCTPGPAPGDAGAPCADAPFRPVCDPSRGVCVECVDSGDCGGPASLGPICQTGRGYCTCASQDDCAGNANGPRCHPTVHACTCIDDSDCESPATCEQQPYLGGGVRVCTVPSSAVRQM